MGRGRGLLFLVGAILAVTFLGGVYIVSQSSLASVSKSEIYGTWKGKTSYGSEAFTVREDGTYVQELFRDGHSEVNRGRWRWDEKRHDLNMDDCLIVIEGELVKGICGWHPERELWFFGRLYIGSGDQLQTLYKQ